MNSIRGLLKGRGHVRAWAALIALAFSVAIIAVDIVSYRQYRSGLVRTEQNQLLTIARTVGTGLSKYVEGEIDKIDLCLDNLAVIGEADADAVRRISGQVVDASGGLYRGCVCLMRGEVVFRAGDVPATAGDYAGAVTEKAGILGKYQGESGWYEMLIGKRVPLEGGACDAVFVMDLNRVYQTVVSPVRIGQGGYSVVKDRNLAIIMHHAQNQIGMDALYDREEQYPQLNLESLKAWLELQRSEPEGTGLLDSYVWDDPRLAPVRRIVAYTTIDIAGERWIVNSTLPVTELSDPLRRMILVMAGLTLLYLSVMLVVVSAATRSLTRGVAQKREIEYLKEINHGMQLIASQNDQIRHYQRVQSLGMMSSHIAHEFNNYLTPVMVYGEMLAAEEGLSEDDRLMVREMLKSVEQASQLSRDLLDFSRMDAGGRAKPLNLTEEIAEAVSVVRQLTPKRIAFSAELSDAPAWLVGRPGMMQHILMNLCKNAFQAMEAGDGNRLTVTYAILEGRARLDVSDTGCGIRREDMEHIFEPYYTTKGSRQGTGLGLSVVRGLVEKVHGSIAVESEPSRGTTFHMVFPVAAEEAALAPEAVTRQARRALCVCRSRQELQLWKAQLSALASAQETVTSEATAAARLKQDPGRYDLLILQQTLDSMSGAEFANIVRSMNPDVPIVILAGQVDDALTWYLDNGIVDRIISKEDG